MSSNGQPLAIRCRGLSKHYYLGEHLSLQRSLAGVLPGRSAALPEFAALKRITFDVPQGAYFGIVGSNGSGKSTLTQVIAGISVPSEGEVEVRGRVLPLLEVGSGFNEELTGQENIALLGAILGLSRRETSAAFPRIIEFAGVEAHVNTPLKRYSSGMRARLSFATAICFPADIYVFDEVLAVVDDDFRATCVQELKKLNARGRTIIFMSHDLKLVVSSCTTGMWLEKGEVKIQGSMEEVGRAYAAGHPALAPVPAVG